MRKTLVVMTALFLASCADPYATAKMTLLGARAVVPVVTAIMDGLDKAKKAECAKKGAVGSPEYTACYAKMKQHMENWARGKPIAVASVDQAEAIVRAAESANIKDVKTWIEPGKKAVCLIDATLVFLPQKYQDNVWVKMVRGFATSWAGCGKTSLKPLFDNPALAAALAKKVEQRVLASQ
jgi:hypothetical protein